jgi:hypothetical protein
MINSIFTTHAEKQIKRRTAKQPVNCLLEYGRDYKCTSGTVRCQFDKESFQEACNDGYYSRQTLEKARNLYAILNGGVIITVASRTRRHLRDL